MDAGADLPPGYRYGFAGQYENPLREPTRASARRLLIAVVLVILTLSAILESFRQPWLILVTLPLALIGVMWSLALAKMAMDMFVIMGIVMMIGIVVNNAILIMDQFNVHVKEGVSRHKAMIAATCERFRPITMITIAAVLGMLPLALGRGIGAELRNGVGVASAGGILVSGILTLFVLPILYDMCTRRTEEDDHPPLEQPLPGNQAHTLSVKGIGRSGACSTRRPTRVRASTTESLLGKVSALPPASASPVSDRASEPATVTSEVDRSFRTSVVAPYQASCSSLNPSYVSGLIHEPASSPAPTRDAGSVHRTPPAGRSPASACRRLVRSSPLSNNPSHPSNNARRSVNNHRAYPCQAAPWGASPSGPAPRPPCGSRPLLASLSGRITFALADHHDLVHDEGS